jgi:N-dimethylarginine dimethylaminohydrolase
MVLPSRYLFCPLSDEHVLFYPPAFDSTVSKFWKNISRILFQLRLRGCSIRLQRNRRGQKYRDEYRLPRVREKLEALSFRVFETPLDEFIKAGGSAKCLVLCIH